MKRALLINGSPRGEQSASFKLAREFFDGYADRSGAAGRVVHLKTAGIAPCAGCFACWKGTPGKCAIPDGMDEVLLRAYAEADLVVLSTPVYHYGMSALLKAFFERTLPMLYPYMVKKEGLYGHPRRMNTNPEQRFVAFATCGFPDEDNFRPLSVHLKKLLGPRLAAEFHIPEGELYRQAELAPRMEPRMAALRAAGRFFAETGIVPPEAFAATEAPVGAENFAAAANASWEVAGERVPTAEETAGMADYRPEAYTEADSRGAPIRPAGNGAAYLTRMSAFFNPDAAAGLDATIAFNFTDIGERVGLRIAEGRCSVEESNPGDAPNLLIVTPLGTWRKIGEGELDGQEALMQGAYRIEGDFGLLMKMHGLFGEAAAKDDSGSEKRTAGTDKKKRSLMALAFGPWYFGWWFGGSSPWIGQALPLAISLCWLAYRERRGEATWFERGTPLAFAFLTGIAFLAPAAFEPRWNAAVNAGIALIWGTSLLYRRPLTADYSKRDYPENVASGPLFRRVNEILTALWAALFAAEAVAGFLITGIGQGTLALTCGILLIPAGIFTARFPKWYPAYLAKGGEKRSVR